MLDSTFESAEALKGYSTNPEHVKVADSTVRSVTTARRSCVDFESIRKDMTYMKAHGTVHKYGDNVDTDVIIPARYLNTADHKELASSLYGGHRQGLS